MKNFISYGDFYILPIINLLNFKFEKKKSFLPPESRDLQAVMALSTNVYHYSVLDSGQSQKNYNKRAVYIKLFLARECAWLTIEEREK